MATMLRSLLFVPGSSDRMISKAWTCGADAVILDLEDAVSPEGKDAARERVGEALRNRLHHPHPQVWVRINSVGDEVEVADVRAIAAGRPDGILLPKADSAALAVLEQQLDDLPNTGEDAIAIAALIETCRGLLDSERMCAGSRRLVALQLGAEDLTKELGVPRTAAGSEIQYARSHLVVVGHAYAKQVWDTPNTNIHDLDQLRQDVAVARALGMTDKPCIHPKQLAVVNDEFRPSRAAIAEARRIITAFEAGRADGRGAVALDGRMIDAPIVERAKAVLEQAQTTATR